MLGSDFSWLILETFQALGLLFFLDFDMPPQLKILLQYLCRLNLMFFGKILPSSLIDEQTISNYSTYTDSFV